MAEMKTVTINGVTYKIEDPDALSGTDTTLTQPNKAADAAAVGAALAGKVSAQESAAYPGCFFRTVAGETEWINPPMVMGEEYRTSERHEGKPVYVKLVNCGQAKNATTVTLGDNSMYVIRFHSRTGQNTPLPFINKTLEYGYTIWTNAEGRTLHIWCGADRVGTVIYTTVWYTKN